MIEGARFVHVSLVARDWRRLAAFYKRVFGCEQVGPERDLSGAWLEDGTGVPGAAIRGVHLRLPGAGSDGPTVEIFRYSELQEGSATSINRPGWAHIAFAVYDVAQARQEILEAGGGEVGEIVTLDVPGAGQVTFAYLTDPEGNIIELQQWHS